jgi:hypothetical protein
MGTKLRLVCLLSSSKTRQDFKQGDDNDECYSEGIFGLIDKIEHGNFKLDPNALHCKLFFMELHYQLKTSIDYTQQYINNSRQLVMNHTSRYSCVLRIKS